MADVSKPSPGSIFISHKLGESGDEAGKLKDALLERGVAVYMRTGEDENMAEIANELARCQLAIVMGTTGYGEHTKSPFSTFDELQFIQCNKPDSCYFVKMCDRFLEPVRKYRKAHQRHLSTTTMLLTAFSKGNGPVEWAPGKGKRIPLGLVDDILVNLKHAAEMDRDFERVPLPITPMQSDRLFTMKATTTLAVDQTTALPAWAVELSPQGAAKKLQNEARMGERSAMIMSVDDDEGQQLIVKGVFGSMGCTVDTAMSGEDALVKLESTQVLPDVMLLDFSMAPGMSGIEVARKLRMKYPKYLLPIIMVSAADENIAVDCLAHGCNDFVTKPFEHTELRARVETQLCLRRAWKEDMQRQYAKYDAHLASGKGKAKASSDMSGVSIGAGVIDSSKSIFGAAGVGAAFDKTMPTGVGNSMLGAEGAQKDQLRACKAEQHLSASVSKLLNFAAATTRPEPKWVLHSEKAQPAAVTGNVSLLSDPQSRAT
jgi:CheY-like chemotaxis protein